MNPLLSRKWEKKTAVRELEPELAVACPLLEKILQQRGYITSAERAAFLKPSYEQLHDPYLFRDMGLAVELLASLVGREAEIVVYGDYDCDGLTATALMLKCLGHLGLKARAMIPNRLDDGYGLSQSAVTEIIQNPPALVLTVDCASSAAEEVKRLLEAGIPVIITDHHEVAAVGAQPLALLNPHALGETYPNKDLAGVGVAFKLVQALADKYSQLGDFMPEALSLTMLGTVADTMLLQGENRALVHLGLKTLSQHGPLGLRQLLGKLRGKEQTVDSIFAAFSIAPRLNAAGRMGNTEPALQLLLTGAEDIASQALETLEAMNEQRRQLEKEIFEQAVAQVQQLPSAEREGVLVVANENWHIGVIGIVSARLCEKYGLPSICLGGSNGELRGSARSVEGFDILAAISKCAAQTKNFGGHSQAAGITLLPAQLPEFTRLLRQAVLELDGSRSEASLGYDLELEHDCLDEQSARELEQLAPYGEGNEEAVFYLRSLQVLSLRKVGVGQHLSAVLGLNDGRQVRAIGFKMGAFAQIISPGSRIDVLALLKWHVWNGRGELQLQLLDLRPVQVSKELCNQFQLIDHSYKSGLHLTELRTQFALNEADTVLAPKQLALTYNALNLKLAQGALHFDMPYLALALQEESQLSVSAFALARILDILTEAQIFSCSTTNSKHWRLSACANTGQKPVLSAQASWQRLKAEGGLSDV